MTTQEAIAKSGCVLALRRQPNGKLWLYDAQQLPEQVAGFDDYADPNFLKHNPATATRFRDWQPCFLKEYVAVVVGDPFS